MVSKLIKLDTEEDFKKGLKRGAHVLISGGVVAFPTESFYGLAVNATDEEAIRRLFNVKRRRTEQPILILIPSLDVLDGYVSHINDIAHRLMKRFWPGGLTLVFEAGPVISPFLTGGTGKIGVRLSSHPVARALAQAVNVPITGTSANISGQPVCLNATEVFHSLGEKVDLILDGGQTSGGKGSTVLDVTVDPPLVLREGMVGREQLEKYLSE